LIFTNLIILTKEFKIVAKVVDSTNAIDWARRV
jgi:hypothetical protein